LFKNNLDGILSVKKEPSYKKYLGEYGNIHSLKQVYITKNPALAKKIEKLSSNGNLRKIENLYNKFIDSTLQTLAESNSVEFTTFWVNNKQLGNKNLTDLWLKSLGKNIENISSEEKRDLLNNLTKEDKKKLIEITTAEYIDNILPVELNRENNTDIDELNQVDSSVSEILSEIEQSKKQNLDSIFKDDKF